VAAWPSPSSIDGRRPRNGTIAVCTTTSPIEAASPTASASRASAARVASCRSARSQGRMTAARVGRLEPAPFRPPFMPSRSLNDGSGWLAHRAAFSLRGVEQLDRRARHHGADRVLVDQLRMPVPAEQDGEIVEPGDDALQLDAVDQEHGHGGLVLPHMVQEDVLNVLRFLVGHGAILLLLVDVVACYRHPPSWHADGHHHILAAALPCASARSRAAKPCACSKCRSAPARSTPPSGAASPTRTAVTPAARAASMSFAVSPRYHTDRVASASSCERASKIGAALGLSAAASPAPITAPNSGDQPRCATSARRNFPDLFDTTPCGHARPASSASSAPGIGRTLSR